MFYRTNLKPLPCVVDRFWGSPWPPPLYTSCNSFSLSVGRIYDSLQTNRTWQRWWYVTSVVKIHYIRLHLASRLTLDGHCPRRLDEVSDCTEEASVVRSWGHPLPNSKQKTKVLSPTTARDWMLLTTMLVGKQIFPHSSLHMRDHFWPTTFLQPVETRSRGTG